MNKFICIKEETNSLISLYIDKKIKIETFRVNSILRLRVIEIEIIIL